jgi:dihydroorotase (multifunctional complex type)
MFSDCIDLRIDNGLIWAENGLQPCSIGINQDKIVALISREKAGLFPARQIMDVDGQWILPGGVDLHVHISDGVETFYQGSCCAAVGGITTVFDMAPFHACVTPQQFKEKVELAEREMVVDFGLIGGIVVSDEDLLSLAELRSLGAAYFKVFMPAEPPVTTQTLWRAVKAAAKTGLRLGLHAEDSGCLEEADWSDPLAFPHSRPVVAESSVVGQVLEMARAAGAPIHICHVSASRTCELIAWGKAQGIDVTAETAPHYLLLNEEDFRQYGVKVKTTPPLRGKQNNLDLWTALSDGTIDVLACDHYIETASMTSPELQNIKYAPAGIAGLETSLPLIFSEGVLNHRFTLQRFVEMTSLKPSILAGISRQKGCLGVGKDADFIVVDPKRKWEVGVQGPFSRVTTTPFSGWSLNGKITQTWVRGSQVWDGNNILKTAGWGRWISSRREKYD